MTDQTQKAGRLVGRRVVIAGGGSGIGLATARLFAREDASVMIFDRDLAAARAAAAACGGAGVAVDIADEKALVAAIATAEEILGGIDGLVNTAGVFDPATLADTDLDLWSRMIAVNLTGTYLLCRHVLPALRRETGGTIVTLGSATGLMPTGPGSAAYAAAKGGVVALTRALAAEVAPAVRVNCVCPGMVDTPMTTTVLRDHEGNTKPTVTNNYALRRAATPDEIAAAVLFLTSSESSFVTGTTLAVDGGRTYH
ncbi:SDR family NAD(P)-dependent oxidoreductase [Chelatococcus asaccharovorans]|uniref:NAD(P)-dependent dehydrogenase (Short-subunit alcohol dehydrogenase family) n=1 Tax=Chelatococcus asaccharovorans TaxID=28210 RepID=A0A2V3TTS1_9HYPH|nr:SDR family NAD(P)-dependent oxidoreductase [Chelatococcus asaccharovorans]MBS7706116.1 SDR family oxidoreductase [Chelatococcus asaccharovorans]PXW52486.1 NAD(P)-dependent dehydrogenase (short-subunit alcohol dehydrogenase family) [Chelatococcus asaccharovorans]CAH1659475.1 2-(S)-hydroxypropyl-CoM dehydrogenase [Chelatococcus asaccharovorans]CAH1687919.1 2-(S)-hydroxypropyl-CoM dehydrogenase [Chelatococcus asaccharovorans]